MTGRPRTLFRLRRAEIVFVLILACIVAVVTIVVRAEPPPVVPLRSIHFDTEQYIGKRVEVSGVVRVFQDTGAPYYVLEDAQENRVLLRSDGRQLSLHVDRALTVIGVVGFDDHVGIYLTVERMSASPQESPLGKQG